MDVLHDMCTCYIAGVAREGLEGRLVWGEDDAIDEAADHHHHLCQRPQGTSMSHAEAQHKAAMP